MQVFEAEQENDHLEPVVSCRYAALHIGKVLSARVKNGSSVSDEFKTRVLALCNQARDCIRQLSVANGTSVWLGGPSHQGDVFSGVGGVILGAAAAGRAWKEVCVDVEAEAELLALCDGMLEGGRLHPLIARALQYFRLVFGDVWDHEHHASVVTDVLTCSGSQ